MKSESFDPAEFLRVKGHLPEGARCRVEVLSGGYASQVFRVVADGFDLVVKRYHPGAGPVRFPNRPDLEARALDFLADQEIAPRRRDFFPKQADGWPVLLYDYLEGPMGTRSQSRLAEVMRRFHGLDCGPLVGDFRMLDWDPEAICAEGDSYLHEGGPVELVAAILARRPQARSVAAPGAVSLVHSDLGPGNLVESPQGLRIIDWQCCGLGDPAEDLYAALSPAFRVLSGKGPLLIRERAAFLVAYDSEALAERLWQMEPFYSFRMLGYCCYRHRALAAENPEASARYRAAAEAEFERFCLL